MAARADISMDLAVALLGSRVKAAAHTKSAFGEGAGAAVSEAADKIISPPSVSVGGQQFTDPGWGAAQWGLAGAAGLGSVSLIRSLMDKERRKRALQDGLRGALLGGGLGAGASLVRSLPYASALLGRGDTDNGDRERENPTRDGAIETLYRRIRNTFSGTVDEQPVAAPPATLRQHTTGALAGGISGGLIGSTADKQINRWLANAPLRADAPAYNRRMAEYNGPQLRERLVNYGYENPTRISPAAMAELRARTGPVTELPGMSQIDFNAARMAANAVSGAPAAPQQVAPLARSELRGGRGPGRAGGTIGTLGGGIFGAVAAPLIADLFRHPRPTINATGNALGMQAQP